MFQLLVIKDEYSGKLQAYLILRKSKDYVLKTLQSFENRTRRQYSLTIYKIKYNNNTSAIGIKGQTKYKQQANIEGIELELTLLNTHEPNRGVERTGQELIT